MVTAIYLKVFPWYKCGLFVRYDTAFYYFLNISDFRVAGEQEPYEFAQPKVKDMLVNIKRVDFMKQVKDDLYERAVKRKKIINY